MALLSPQLRKQYNTAKGRQALLTQGVDLVRNILFVLFVLRLARKSVLQLRGYGLFGSVQQLYAQVYRRLYALFLRLPFVQAKMQADVKKAITELQSKLVPSGPGVINYHALPVQGWTPEQVRAELEKLGEMEHTRWEDGRVSGAVYHGGDELADLQSDAFKRFGVSNPIHPDVFPGVRKMEAEVVAMTLGLFNAPDTGAGVTTSGGTESILMAVLAARQKALHERGVTEPEMVLPNTAHTAFRKAGEYFKIKIHLVACPEPSYRVHIPSVNRLINSNTILLVGSAPNFPHGIVDDIPALSRLATKHKLPLHVDCCLGSFVIAFLSKAGFPSPDFDFRVPGVTSISVDTHKYGFAPKGNSVVLYRTAELRRYQYYICETWSGGVYASPNMAGSRPGALIAGCWASLMRFGEDGYVNTTLKIVSAAKQIEDAIRSSEKVRHSIAVIGKPMVSVVAFRALPNHKSPHLAVDIYDLADAMSAKGWHLNALQDPPAIHVAVTMPIVSAVDALISDLEEVVETCKGHVTSKKGDTAALYGVAGSIPDKSVVKYLATGFLDTLYKT
ncbi:Putative pyridoxal phosphate-dependent decarboxylase, pyridoxal phosphate-dependent transferase [Septoria linicola]|uniref:sphinganine-1-phosphate aldolase n=1 Tax=Septoria linicola TaxID=215465 RepID=A0A9Q9AKH1_9PEZI|nr:putative pyridoxal phosphate-dependent decarboxylase, pyridoxal phosphate-dependent transferase [Septoria linicola]USW47803.1 Putative pyridoxal phosphate-dependent decarboxylase, pyridoxal phosphate-dependent transferase [Septoria linicola]